MHETEISILAYVGDILNKSAKLNVRACLSAQRFMSHIEKSGLNMGIRSSTVQ